MFRFFSDPAMTAAIATVPVATLLSSTPEPIPAVVYFGNPLPGYELRAAAGNVTISVADAAPASGLPVSAVRLALAAEDLAAAVPGATLDLGASLPSGAGQQVEIWIDVTHDVAGAFTDLSLVTNAVYEALA